MTNAWIKHLKEFYAKNKDKMSYKQAMKEAKKTYKGGDSKGKSKSKAKSTKPKKTLEEQEMENLMRKIERGEIIKQGSLKRDAEKKLKDELKSLGLSDPDDVRRQLGLKKALTGGVLKEQKGKPLSVKEERAKLVRKYGEFKKAVMEGLRKGILNQKAFNNFMGLAKILAGSSKTNKYAKDAKKIEKEFKSKKYQKLKEKATETYSKKSLKQLENLERLVQRDFEMKSGRDVRMAKDDKLRQRKEEYIQRQVDEGLTREQALKKWKQIEKREKDQISAVEDATNILKKALEKDEKKEALDAITTIQKGVKGKKGKEKKKTVAEDVAKGIILSQAVGTPAQSSLTIIQQEPKVEKVDKKFREKLNTRLKVFQDKNYFGSKANAEKYLLKTDRKTKEKSFKVRPIQLFQEIAKYDRDDLINIIKSENLGTFNDMMNLYDEINAELLDTPQPPPPLPPSPSGAVATPPLTFLDNYRNQLDIMYKLLNNDMTYNEAFNAGLISATGNLPNEKLNLNDRLAGLEKIREIHLSRQDKGLTITTEFIKRLDDEILYLSDKYSKEDELASGHQENIQMLVEDPGLAPSQHLNLNPSIGEMMNNLLKGIKNLQFRGLTPQGIAEELYDLSEEEANKLKIQITHDITQGDYKDFGVPAYTNPSQITLLVNGIIPNILNSFTRGQNLDDRFDVGVADDDGDNIIKDTLEEILDGNADFDNVVFDIPGDELNEINRFVSTPQLLFDKEGLPILNPIPLEEEDPRPTIPAQQLPLQSTLPPPPLETVGEEGAEPVEPVVSLPPPQLDETPQPVVEEGDDELKRRIKQFKNAVDNRIDVFNTSQGVFITTGYKTSREFMLLRNQFPEIITAGIPNYFFEGSPANKDLKSREDKIGKLTEELLNIEGDLNEIEIMETDGRDSKKYKSKLAQYEKKEKEINEKKDALSKFKNKANTFMKLGIDYKLLGKTKIKNYGDLEGAGLTGGRLSFNKSKVKRTNGLDNLKDAVGGALIGGGRFKNRTVLGATMSRFGINPLEALHDAAIRVKDEKIENYKSRRDDIMSDLRNMGNKILNSKAGQQIKHRVNYVDKHIKGKEGKSVFKKMLGRGFEDRHLTNQKYIDFHRNKGYYPNCDFKYSGLE